MIDVLHVQEGVAAEHMGGHPLDYFLIPVFICNVVVCVSRVCRVVIMSQKNIYSEETDKKYSGSPS